MSSTTPPKARVAPRPKTTPSRIMRAVGGDRDAADVLLSELRPRMRNVVRNFVRRDTDVDDVTQLAMVALLQALPQYRGEGNIVSFADKITARASFAWMRKARRARVVITTSVPTHEATDLGAETTSDSHTLGRQLAERLEELPAEQRRIVELHHITGLSLREIAEQLGIPFETARSRLRLAMASLREELVPDE